MLDVCSQVSSDDASNETEDVSDYGTEGESDAEGDNNMGRESEKARQNIMACTSLESFLNRKSRLESVTDSSVTDRRILLTTHCS